MKSKAAIWIVLGLVSGWSAMAANVYVVPPGTPGSTPSAPYTSWATAATNIADAITAIVTNDGNIVFISNGTYNLPDQITVNKGVILRSWKDGQTDRDGTILDGNNYPGKPVTNRVITLDHPEAVLDGLTIQGGGPIQVSNPRDPRGAGVFIYRSAMITNCVIANNIPVVPTHGNSLGGGVYMDSTYTNLGVITHCLITSNQAFSGGGVYISSGAIGCVEYCQIVSNLATASEAAIGGGGVFINNVAGNVLRNCFIARNTAVHDGSGVNVLYSGIIENCLIVSNHCTGSYASARAGGAVFLYSRGVDGVGVPVVRNCLIHGNTAFAYGGLGVYVNAATPCREVAARIENCTIVDNSRFGYRRHDPAGSSATSAVHFVNSVIYGNNTEISTPTLTSFTNCLSSVASYNQKLCI